VADPELPETSFALALENLPEKLTLIRISKRHSLSINVYNIDHGPVIRLENFLLGLQLHSSETRLLRSLPEFLEFALVAGTLKKERIFFYRIISEDPS